MEIGARTILGLGFFLPNGVEGEFIANTGQMGDNASTLRIALGCHILDWAKFMAGSFDGKNLPESSRENRILLSNAR